MSLVQRLQLLTRVLEQDNDLPPGTRRAMERVRERLAREAGTARAA